MIASLTGILRTKTPTEVLVDVQGVGYAVSIPLSTFEHLPVTLLTHLQVREDAFQLYGFESENERLLFRHLISVNGIGPRIAQSILSGISVDDLRDQILQGNVGALTAIPGIGRKTAERLVLELEGAVRSVRGVARLGSVASPSARPADDIRTQALLALTSLGYSRPVAEKALRSVLNESPGVTLTIEELIKKALRYATTP